MSDNEIKHLLRSLPTVKASESLESRLNQAIDHREKRVPHMLGSLPMVPAHEDFDARLMQAIRERRRRVVPPLDGVAGGGAFVWSRWLAGAVVAGGLLFSFLNTSEFEPEGSRQAAAPAAVTRIADVPSGPVTPPAGSFALHGNVFRSDIAWKQALSIIAAAAPAVEMLAPEQPRQARSAARIPRSATQASALQSRRTESGVPRIQIPAALAAIAPPEALPVAYSHPVLRPAQFKPDPAATGSDIREDQNDAPR